MDAPFKWGPVTYNCTEQKFFAAKAQLLGDERALGRIMAAKDGAKALYEGRRIVDHTHEDWSKVEEMEMKNANRQKYLQNPKAMEALMATKQTRIGEASKDGHWGIGFTMHDPEKVDQLRWKKNIFGEILMALRLEFTN
jgi:hypothetical protein